MIPAEEYRKEFQKLPKGALNYEWNAIIEQIQQDASQPKWISVKDRLPEAGPVVLVYATRTYGHYLQMSIGTARLGERIRDSTPEWRGESDFVDGGDSEDYYLDVTHWMPLPEPPKDA